MSYLILIFLLQRCEKRMMLQRCESGFKLRKLNDAVEEDNVTQMESNITHENTLVSEPEATLGPQTTEPTTEGTVFLHTLYFLVFSVCN